MASDYVYDGEQPNNQENVILRAIVGDPNRHKPLAQHPPPTTAATPKDDIPASMYTLETSRQPILTRVLPKSTSSSRLPSSNNPEQPPETEKEEDKPLYVEPNVLNHVKEEPEAEPIIFLEPKIISQPILYSIVGAKTMPIRNEQPISSDGETHQPVFYAVMGQPNRSTIDVNTITLNVAKPIIDKSPFLYSLVGSPRRHVRIQEPIEEKSEQPLPPPLLHSIVGNPNLHSNIQEPVKTAVPTTQQSSASLYSIVGNPTYTPRITPPDTLDVNPSKQVQPGAILYTVVGNSQVPPTMPVQTHSSPAPVKKQTNTLIPSPVQPTPVLYSIVGDTQVPANMPKVQRTVPAPVKKQANTFVPIPLTQSVEYSPVQPVPVLYTVVGETQVPNNIAKEDRPPAVPVKKQTNGINMYTIVGDPHVPPLITPPVKTQQPVKQQTSPQRPSFYPLVGNPDSPSEEKMVIRSEPPPRAIVPTRRISRSLDRQTAPESSTNELLSPQKQNRRRAKSREPTIPKSETIFIPLSEDEHLPQIKQPRTARRKRSFGQIHHKPFTIEQYGPLQLTDYVSPYAYHPAEPYRERTYKPTAFPLMRNPRSEQRAIQPSYAPYYRRERKHPHHLSMPRSLERDPAKTRRSDRLWDYEDTAQTDYDDDDEDLSNLDSSRRKQRYRRFRPRTPWIPVW